MAGLQVWAGQLGVLAPWGAIAVAAPGPLWAPTSVCDLGVNYGKTSVVVQDGLCF